MEGMPDLSVLPDWADLRCTECGGKVVALTAVVSDPPRVPIWAEPCVWVQDGPRVLGWTLGPCLHFVDCDVWELTYRISVEESTVTFEPVRAVK
jgi:hypothetical protein